MPKIERINVVPVTENRNMIDPIFGHKIGVSSSKKFTLSFTIGKTIWRSQTNYDTWEKANKARNRLQRKYSE